MKVTLSIASKGSGLIARVTGPLGECGMWPYQSDDPDRVLEYVTAMVRFETQRALHDLDDEAGKVRATSAPAWPSKEWRCGLCNLSWDSYMARDQHMRLKHGTP